MRPKPLHLVLCASIALALPALRGQAPGDPQAQDSYLTAYQDFQEAEKLESAGSHAQALQTYRETAKLLDQISTKWPTWNPSIVEYRRKRTTEAIQKIAAKGVSEPPSRGGDSGEPQLPTDGFPTLPDSAPADLAPRGHRPPRTAPPVAPSDPIQAIQAQLQDLQSRLKQEHDQLEAALTEKKDLETKLAEASKARKDAESKQELLKTRADLAEEKLTSALKSSAANSQKVKSLQTDADKAHAALREYQIEREASDQVRQQIEERLSSSQKKASQLQKESDAAVKLSSEATAKIQDAQKRADNAITAEKKRSEAAIADAQGKMTEAIKERDAINTQLGQVTQQRDEAIGQVKKLKESQKQVDKLVSDNTRLMAQLTEAEKQIGQFKTEGAEKDAKIADLNKQVAGAQQQLASTKKESALFQTHMAEIQSKLDQTQKDLASTKSDSAAGAVEKKKMQEENDVLHGIVMRALKEESWRSQTRKVVLEQVSKIDVKSADLLKQIKRLGQPVVALTPKERAMFKKPQVEIGDQEISMATPRQDGQDDAATTAPPDAAPEPKPSPQEAPKSAAIPSPAKSPAPPAPQPVAASNPKSAPAAPAVPSKTVTPGGDSGALAMLSPKKDGSAAPAEAPKSVPSDSGSTLSKGKGDLANSDADLPKELKPVMQEAKDAFERGNYRDAERLYDKILAQSPSNLAALDNMGVVRLKEGKLKLAEESLKKAIATAPEDPFSHSTLGIVYYGEQRYDDAVNELTKSLAINNKNPAAHNYLGITASQKGWPEAAQKELETATALDPNYADAQFNLAVVFATQQPPNKDNARKCYKRAVELGAEPDPSLEQLLK